MKKGIKERMTNSLRKGAQRITASFVACSLLTFGFIFSPQSASAWFTDAEVSLHNVFSAGQLDVVLSASSVYSSVVLYPTQSATVANTVSSAGQVPLQYTTTLGLNGINNAPCDYIIVTAANDTQTVTAAISSFSTVAEMLATPSAWTYTFTVNANAPPNVWGKTCFFKWVYTAWQANLPDASSGFTDTAERLGSVRIGKAVVLNEFITNPLGADNAAKPGGEWVELYNNSSVPVDVAGWYVYDNNDAHALAITNTNTDTGDTIVPAHGWLVVYRNGDVNFELDNAGDSVRLYTGNPVGSSVLVDEYTYDDEKPEGFSFARIPDGVGNWVDPDPTPGKPNTLEPVEEHTAVLQEPEIAQEMAAEDTTEEVVEATPEQPEQDVPEQVIAASGTGGGASQAEEDQQELSQTEADVTSEAELPVTETETLEEGTLETTDQQEVEVVVEEAQVEPESMLVETTSEEENVPQEPAPEQVPDAAPEIKPTEEVSVPETVAVPLPDPIIPPLPVSTEGSRPEEGGADA